MYFFKMCVQVNIFIVREYSKKSRTNENFDDFKLAEKKYKKVMDEAILAHRRKLSREINNLKSSNSQEFKCGFRRV
jgi:hypothetical protein